MHTLDLVDEEINEFEKTIICIIASYLRVHPIGLNISQWYDIANFICIDTNIIQKMLDSIDLNNDFIYSNLKMNGEIIDLNEYWLGYQIFECILNYYFIHNCIQQIKVNNEKEFLISNYKSYQSAAHNMNMMNVCSGAYECSCNQIFSREYAPQSFESFHPSYYIDILQLYIFSDDYFKQNRNMLPILYRIINYEIISHANSMYLVVVSQILKHSKFYNEKIHNIAEALYDNMRFLLKDARVISVQINLLYQDTHKNYKERNKQTDNTTRLHILYGYDNYDSYSLRLDLSHKGIGWIHYNNKSPGGVKSYFFSPVEYNSIIKVMPSMSKYFINYGNRWFLKEKCNCNLEKEEYQLFELIQKRKEHTHAFKNMHSEDNVIAFLYEINKFLSGLFINIIEKNEENARYCFNYDKLMSWLELYNICKMHADDTGARDFSDLIIKRAINYGIILPCDEKNYMSDEGLQLIIDLAYDRCSH